ncbi:MAG: biliverdin-producing heme oxygenase [Pseudomonadota bacterium]
MSNSKRPSLRDRLRTETSAAHDKIDALFGTPDFTTVKGYVAFLRAQSVAWETLRPLLDEGSLDRADALRRDLGELGLATPGPLADVDLTETASMGHRYVLEGSRLGSAVLLRMLQADSPSLADRASDYLVESSKTTGWKKLSTSLQIYSDAYGNEEQIIDDALFTFGLFERSWRAAMVSPLE